MPESQLQLQPLIIVKGRQQPTQHNLALEIVPSDNDYWRETAEVCTGAARKDASRTAPHGVPETLNVLCHNRFETVARVKCVASLSVTGMKE